MTLNRPLILLTTFAITICLSLCMLPQAVAKNSAASHCHEEKEKNTKESAMTCCKGQAILSNVSAFLPPIQQQGFVRPGSELPAPDISAILDSYALSFSEGFPPPSTVVLRT